MKLTNNELYQLEVYNHLKEKSGSHSPSVFELKEKINDIELKVDACFLSNPYATDLFYKFFHKELILTGKLRDALEFYPSQNNVIAKTIGSFLSINDASIFVGNGAIETIQAIIHNFTQKKILINIPTFSSYYEYVKPGIEVIYNQLKKEDNFQLNCDTYLETINREKPDTIVLINPNNPDGGYIARDKIIHILENTKSVNTVIIDESFIHFSYENKDMDYFSVSEMIDKYPNLCVIKSMSKDFGIAGIRAGYCIMNHERVKHLLNNGYLWNINGMAEYFFRLYTRADFAYEYNIVRLKYIHETESFIKELKENTWIKTYPGKANFVLVEFPDDINLDELCFALLSRYGIYVRNCSDKIGLNGNFIRIASRTELQNKEIIMALRSINE